VRIHNRFQIDRACAHESTKYAIACVHVRDVGGEPRAIATDGRILAIVPVELGPNDVLGAYHAEAFRFSREQFLAGIDDEFSFDDRADLNHPEMCYGLHLQGKGVAEVGFVTIGQGDGAALPDIDAVRKPKDPPLAVLSLGVDYLRRLCDAIGTQKVTIEFRGDKVPMVVRPAVGWGNGSGAVGLLMPMSNEESAEGAAKPTGGAP
jgi:hypothetical protein